MKRTVLERISVRGIGRVFWMSRHTMSRWLGDCLQDQLPLQDTLLPAEREGVLEVDELWRLSVNRHTSDSSGWISAVAPDKWWHWLGGRSEASAIYF